MFSSTYLAPIGPPWAEIVAYDLNTGEIKWQGPNGGHLPTLAAGGPANTGGVGARFGIVVTKGGLVFHAGNDGKVRAYDEDTGKVLWTGTFPGSTSGVPVSYEAGGRQYFVLIASQGGGRGGRGGAQTQPLDPNAPIEGARSFIQHLNPSDRVGLFVYPTGAKISPTTARTLLTVSLDRVVGQKDPLRSHFNLRPWEIVDIASRSTTPNSFLTASRILNEGLDSATQATDAVLQVQARECPSDPDCPAKIYEEGIGLATQLERQVQGSLSGLDALLNALSELPGRKAVIFVSAGIVVSDRPEGRPDAGSLARTMGQAAARANASVYTVHVDTTTSGVGPASQKGLASSNVARDRALAANWLNDFSNAAGGRLIYVPSGSAEFAFERVLRETSAYYLLGVEPAAADRDGRPRELRVKVHRRGVSVRSRQWVVIPAKS